MGDEMADIKRAFTPEFRNRLDAIVGFKPLDEEIILRVVDKFCCNWKASWLRRRWRSRSPMRCVAIWLAKGFDPLMGARPMQRLIRTPFAGLWPTSCCLVVWWTAVV